MATIFFYGGRGSVPCPPFFSMADVVLYRGRFFFLWRTWFCTVAAFLFFGGRGTVPLPQAVSIVEGEPLPFHDRQPTCERLTPGTCVSLPQGGQAAPTLFDYGSTIWTPWENLKEETWHAVWLAERGWLRRLAGCMFSLLGE